MRKLPPPPKRGRLRRAFTVQNVLATIAVLATFGGTAVAAVLYTGAHVKDSTLTGADVKDFSLQTTDFSTAAQTNLKSKVGAQGLQGPQGAVGATGFTGAKGITGPDAGRAYGYLTADDTGSMLQPKTGNWANPKDAMQTCNEAPNVLPSWLGLNVADCSPYGTTFPHWAYDCEDFIPEYCGFNDNGFGGAGRGATKLNASPLDVIGLGDDSGSFVTLMGPGNIVVTGSLTFARPKMDEFHSRVSCQPEVRKSDATGAYVKLGVPQQVSGTDSIELVHMSVTGAARFEQAGDYDYRVTCYLMDEYTMGNDSDNWIFVAGNATATTTEL